MCGIFAYIGSKNNAATKTYHGLRDLEYRGYDSWGMAVKQPKGFFIKKTVGKISDASEVGFQKVDGSVAIGHSRWATHGGVSTKNAHPHQSRDKRIAVVHNGIIENYHELKKMLEREHKGNSKLFVSDTDTEVISHLIDHYMRKGADFEKAFVRTARKLKGRFAFVAIHKDHDVVLAARDGSPLVFGRAKEGFYFASDVPAFLDHTNVVNYINDREYVRAGKDSSEFFALDSGRRVHPKDKRIKWEKASATKEGWDHYMIKEIMEQAEGIAKASQQTDADIKSVAKLLKSGRLLYFTGCGTAAKVAMVGQYFFSVIAQKPVIAFIASEFPAYRHFVTGSDVLLAVSQSGETADVLEELRTAKKKRTKIASVLNVVGSSIDRMSSQSLYINVGPEIAVASTKAATGQMVVMLLLAYEMAGKLAEGKKFLKGVVRKISAWLTKPYARSIQRIARAIYKHENIYIIGRSLNFPMALESAIKIQEVSYIHAEGFAGGELKHGPIALIGKGTPCIALVPNDETKHDMESNIQELRARGAYIIGVAPEDNPLFDRWIHVPEVGVASPIVNIIPVQILAYYLAVLRGNNPDKPRNLAKSVTVK